MTSTTFRDALGTIGAALPALGDTPTQASLLKLIAVAVNGSDTQLEALDMLLAEKATPRPQPVAPRVLPFPEPTGFDEDPIIGRICGELVRGRQAWDGERGEADRLGAYVELNGLTLSVYPDNASDPNSLGDHVNIGTRPFGAFEGDMSWSDWGKVREIATMTGDPVAQLMALARRWCAGEAEAEAEWRRAA